MKKISIILLVCIFMSQLCVPCGAAESNNSITISAGDYTTTSSSQKQDGMIMLYGGNWAGYTVNLQQPADSLELEFRTGDTHRNIIEIRLDSSKGEVIGSVDTRLVAGEKWVNYTCDINLSTPIVGEHTLYIYGVDGGHWIVGFTLHMMDPNAVVRRFVSVDTEDSFDDISTDANRMRINLLAELGLLSTEESKYLPERPMTRVEFARMIGHAMNAELYATQVTPFLDIAEDNPDAALLAGLHQLGVITGDTEGKFLPNSFIKIEEAALMCVNALGYRPLVHTTVGAIGIATKLKLFKGLDMNSTKLSRSMGASLMYNLLISEQLTSTGIKAGAVVYKSEENFFEKNSSFHYGKGIVSSNHDTGLYDVKYSSKMITIDDESFAEGKTNASGYLGCLCEYFYQETNGHKTLAAIRPVSNAIIETVRSDVGISFEEITERSVVYYNEDEDEKYEYNLSASTAIIYNGVALDCALSSLLKPADFTGTITLIDNDNDSVYDCVRIDHARNVIVSGVSFNKIYDKLSDLVIDTCNGTFDLFIKGRNSKLNVLPTDTVLTVYQSVNKKGDILTRATSNGLTVSGTITSTSEDTVVIEDKQYRIAADCQEKLYPGLTADFYLNDYEEIVRCKTTKDITTQIGVILGVDGNMALLQPEVRIKLLTEKDGVVVFDTAERIVSDGVYVKNDTDFYNGYGMFCGIKNVKLKTPVLYQLNEENQLRMIDTVEKGTGNEDDALTQLGTQNSYLPLGSVLVDPSWQYVHPFRSDAKLIKLTSDDNEKNFEIAVGFVNYKDQRVNIVPYSMKKDSIIADILLADNYSISANDAQEPFIFEACITKLNNDDEAVIYICGYNGQSRISHEIDMDAYTSDAEFKKLLDSLKCGDVLWPTMVNSKIRSMQLAFLPDAESVNEAGIVPLLHENSYAVEKISGRLLHGTVVALEDGFIKIRQGSDDNYTCYKIAGANIAGCEENSNSDLRIVNGQSLGTLIEGDSIVAYLSGYTIVTAFVYHTDWSE